tara:strand:+ start:84 stop:1397 length:1314 start_codon:yes stop_codon:yes gene_type:complete
MRFGLLTLFTALAIAGVAAWFSIVGLMTFFQGAAMSIAVMAGILEVGKLVTVSWLYRYWSETSLLVKTYLSTAVLFLMLITSIGIFGYLSKAHQEVSGSSADAFAVVDRLDGQILREENKIDLLEDRIASLQTGGGLDVSASIQQQETIRDGAWERVQGDIDFANGQIDRLRDQLAVLDKAVNDLRNKGVEVIETDAGGTFRRAETETIDYVAQANQLFAQQESQRADIKVDIGKQQANIDKYREQAQGDINRANAEINKLRENSSADQDDTLTKIDQYNEDIDNIYENIVLIKDEKFEANQIVRDLEKEIGPIKYVAELIYGKSDEETLDTAIRLFIILLVVVFDPLAVMLLIAANQTLLRYGINLEATGPEPHFVDEILDNNKPVKPEVKEIIKEVEVVKEVEKEINMDAIKTPRAVKALEKKLKKKLDDDGTRS